MKITVERCMGNVFRLTTPTGDREYITHEEGDCWSRTYATRALNILHAIYGYKRANIRFEHLN